MHETTQRFVAESQTRPASPQLLSDTHCTQVFVVVLQCGASPPPPVQLVSVVHWTQRLVVVLQTRLPPPGPAFMHCALVVHVVTQRLVVVSHAMPASPQPAFATHWTH